MNKLLLENYNNVLNIVDQYFNCAPYGSKFKIIWSLKPNHSSLPVAGILTNSEIFGITVDIVFGPFFKNL